ncbi:Uncharacterized protein BM_BM10751 [Brugia malayi]|uniref:Bm10751 n=1 Tax=Brugia malayi TaxID=6279 RepID=A0A0J9Y0P5_BRUMA|nr:Uncharacterized protein BM_BM10751 [Brugia malayi]CDP99422.1 Bm10751 [Brugia malayi]VIO99869.1 Uncharacterized protein BM_BM10751 [Brugia malayi]
MGIKRSTNTTRSNLTIASFSTESLSLRADRKCCALQISLAHRCIISPPSHIGKPPYR